MIVGGKKRVQGFGWENVKNRPLGRSRCRWKGAG